jgi:hypothetical protein
MQPRLDVPTSSALTFSIFSGKKNRRKPPLASNPLINFSEPAFLGRIYPGWLAQQPGDIVSGQTEVVMFHLTVCFASSKGIVRTPYTSQTHPRASCAPVIWSCSWGDSIWEKSPPLMSFLSFPLSLGESPRRAD